MQNCKSLFLQIFVHKTFTVEIITKNLPRETRFGLRLFYKGVLEDDHLSKMINFGWSQEWLSYAGLTVALFPFNEYFV